MRFLLSCIAAALLGASAGAQGRQAPPPDSIWVQATNLVLPAGDSIRLPVLARLAGQPYVLRQGEADRRPPVPLTWSSSDAGVARVLGDGWVHARAPGRATIGVSAGGASASSQLTVRSGRDTRWPVREVSAGGLQSCALTAAGAAFCWGGDGFGEAGDGVVRSYASLAAPRAVVGGHRFRSLSAGYAHVCALADGGALYCWGSDSYGQLGDGRSAPARAVPTPTRVLGSAFFVAASAGTWWTCALARGGAAFCWGRSWGAAPQAVGGPAFAALTTGGAHACGLTVEGRAYCWGSNEYGQLGTGSRDESRRPVPVSGRLRFRRLDAGNLHTCGITSDGSAYCWGNNWHGRLGSGRAGHAAVPVAVAGGLRFRGIDAGGTHSCGITDSGRAYCWGNNWRGQLGNGFAFEKLGYTGEDLMDSAPVAVEGGLRWATVAAAETDRSCGITTAGELHCWGDNTAGQLGTGRFAPIPGTAIALSARPIAVTSPP